jgi:transposase
MERRRFAREFKVEAVRLIRDRGVSYAQASQDLKMRPTLRDALPIWRRGKPEALLHHSDRTNEQFQRLMADKALLA